MTKMDIFKRDMTADDIQDVLELEEEITTKIFDELIPLASRALPLLFGIIGDKKIHRLVELHTRYKLTGTVNCYNSHYLKISNERIISNISTTENNSTPKISEVKCGSALIVKPDTDTELIHDLHVSSDMLDFDRINRTITSILDQAIVIFTPDDNSDDIYIDGCLLSSQEIIALNPSDISPNDSLAVTLCGIYEEKLRNIDTIINSINDYVTLAIKAACQNLSLPLMSDPDTLSFDEKLIMGDMLLMMHKHACADLFNTSHLLVTQALSVLRDNIIASNPDKFYEFVRDITDSPFVMLHNLVLDEDVYNIRIKINEDPHTLVNAFMSNKNRVYTIGLTVIQHREFTMNLRFTTDITPSSNSDDAFGYNINFCKQHTSYDHKFKPKQSSMHSGLSLLPLINTHLKQYIDTTLEKRGYTIE